MENPRSNEVKCSYCEKWINIEVQKEIAPLRLVSFFGCIVVMLLVFGKINDTYKRLEFVKDFNLFGFGDKEIESLEGEITIYITLIVLLAVVAFVCFKYMKKEIKVCPCPNRMKF